MKGGNAEDMKSHCSNSSFVLMIKATRARIVDKSYKSKNCGYKLQKLMCGLSHVGA